MSDINSFAAAFGSAVITKSHEDDLIPKNGQFCAYQLFCRLFPEVWCIFRFDCVPEKLILFGKLCHSESGHRQSKNRISHSGFNKLLQSRCGLHINRSRKNALTRCHDLVLSIPFGNDSPPQSGRQLVLQLLPMARPSRSKRSPCPGEQLRIDERILPSSNGRL